MSRYTTRLSTIAHSQQGLFLALASVTAGNVVFHILAGRALGPSDYGTLSALLTILLGLAVPAGAVQVALTTKVVHLRRSDRQVDYQQLALVFAAFGLFGAALLTTGSAALARFLNMRGVSDIYLVGAFFVPTAMGIVYRSVLLGQERFFDLSRILIFGTALRVGAGLILFATQAGVTGALVGTLISEIATTLFLARGCRGDVTAAAKPSPSIPSPSIPSPSIPWRLTLRATEVVAGIAAFGGLWVLLGADTILARHHLDPIDAGAYAATALAARTVLFLPQAAVTAALPKFAAERREAISHLMDTLLICLTLGLAVTVALLGLAQPVGHLVMGSAFPLDSGVMAILAGAAIWLALLTALVNFHLAQGETRLAARVWIGFPVLLILASRTTANPRGLALVVLGSGALATVALTLPLLKAQREQLAASGVGPVALATLDLTIVIPFLNEGNRTRQLISDLVQQLDGMQQLDRKQLDRKQHGGFEIIAVSDGSADDGAELVRAMTDPRVILIDKPASEGKGAALRTGMTLAQGHQIATIDGDGDIAASHLQPMLAELDLFHADAIIGSKHHPRSNAEASSSRKLLSLAGRAAARVLLSSPIPDSQTGIKVFRRDLVVDVLPRTRENGYLFDLELLLAARARGFDHLIESPVQIPSSSQSSVGPLAILKSGISLLRLIGRFSGVGESPAAKPSTERSLQGVTV